MLRALLCILHCAHFFCMTTVVLAVSLLIIFNLSLPQGLFYSAPEFAHCQLPLPGGNYEVQEMFHFFAAAKLQSAAGKYACSGACKFREFAPLINDGGWCG